MHVSDPTNPDREDPNLARAFWAAPTGTEPAPLRLLQAAGDVVAQLTVGTGFVWTPTTVRGLPAREYSQSYGTPPAIVTDAITWAEGGYTFGIYTEGGGPDHAAPGLPALKKMAQGLRLQER